jgi:hypothetical protein
MHVGKAKRAAGGKNQEHLIEWTEEIYQFEKSHPSQVNFASYYMLFAVSGRCRYYWILLT